MRLVAMLSFAVLTALLATGMPLGTPSPAEKAVIQARKAIERNPRSHQNFNRLALALTRRARETANTGYYLKAEEALRTSFELAPGNFEARKIAVWALLGKHEFAAALEEAKALNEKAPDDIQVYGFLVDAHIELGNYAEAEETAQWMLNLRPGNVPGLTRGAYLRELFGDIDGAVDFMHKAYQRTPPEEAEDRAWILTQMAHLYLGAGKVEFAEELVDEALNLFPDYHYALANLGKIRLAQQRLSEAIEVLQRRFELAPHPENLFEVAVALEKAGRLSDARTAFDQFEKLARAEMNGADNCNRDLIFYYADHANRPREALRIARGEIEWRRDVYTLDAYAWALYRNGEHHKARLQIDKALKVGIRDAKIYYHAGAIAEGLDDLARAQGYWRQSLELNPDSEVAALVRERLDRLAAGTPSASLASSLPADRQDPDE